MDIYDQAVEYLSERVHEDEGDTSILWDAWEFPTEIDGGILFEFAGNRFVDERIGCLTQIREGYKIAATPELTVFAEWQRVIDAELGRSAPEKI